MVHYCQRKHFEKETNKLNGANIFAKKVISVQSGNMTSGR